MVNRMRGGQDVNGSVYVRRGRYRLSFITALAVFATPIAGDS